MAFQIGTTTVIDNSRNLTNIANQGTFAGTGAAAIGWDAVGTYAMLAHSNALSSLGVKTEGTTNAGSTLRPAGISLWTTPPADNGTLTAADFNLYKRVTCGGSGLSGTWMIVSREARHGQGVNIWLRIS